MSTTLWENRHVRMLRVDGTISEVRIAHQEPEGVDYFWQVGRRGPGRGTMHGNPAFSDRRDTFHGAVHFERIVMASPDGTADVLTDVVAVRRLRRYLAEGTTCTLYLLSPRGSTAGKSHVFAVRTDAEKAHDLDGVGALADDLEAGLARQLRAITVPVGASLIVTFAMGTLLLAPIVGMRGVTTTALLLAAFFAAAGLAGRALLRAHLKRYPSRRDFADALRMDGWQLP
jgi:hypothetical protein